MQKRKKLKAEITSSKQTTKKTSVKNTETENDHWQSSKHLIINYV